MKRRWVGSKGGIAYAFPASVRLVHVCASSSCRRSDKFFCQRVRSDRSYAETSATPDGGASAGTGRRPRHWRHSTQQTRWLCRCRLGGSLKSALGAIVVHHNDFVAAEENRIESLA